MPQCTFLSRMVYCGIWDNCFMGFARLFYHLHYSDVITSAMASQITGDLIVYSIVCSGTDQRKHPSSTSLAFVRGIHRWPVNSPHKGSSNAENVFIWWRHHGQKAVRALHANKPTCRRYSFYGTLLFERTIPILNKLNKRLSCRWFEMQSRSLDIILVERVCQCNVIYPQYMYDITHCRTQTSLTHLPLDKMAAISQTIF